MSRPLADLVADAVLYEGYVLYPYRPSVKSRQRWTFGGLYPRAYAEPRGGPDAWAMRAECLVVAGPAAALDVKVRFLHLTDRVAGELAAPLDAWPDGPEPAFRAVETLRIGETPYHSWQEATEREVVLDPAELGDLAARPRRMPFEFAAARTVEPLRQPDGRFVGVLVRQREAVAGRVEASAESLGEGLFRVTVRIENLTELPDADRASRDDALLRSLISTHAVLGIGGGEFVSLTDPPDRFRDAAAGCENVGCWPVLVGDEGRADAMLASPIILPDHPQIAPESPGDLFDCTEIDEILSLRILTLTDDEKREMAAVDGRTHALLARTEALARDQLLGLHGAVRGLKPARVGDRLDDEAPP